jgi:hypothetical protein
MKERTVYDCNLCEVTVAEDASVHVQVFRGEPIAHFEEVEMGLAPRMRQQADLCRSCWNKLRRVVAAIDWKARDATEASPPSERWTHHG